MKEIKLKLEKLIRVSLNVGCRLDGLKHQWFKMKHERDGTD